MGCDIHTNVEVWNRKYKIWDEAFYTPFSDRNYGVFAFLTHTVRNYSAVPPVITDKPRGIPEDSLIQEFIKYEPYELEGKHSHSYVSLEELVNFNYTQTFEDRRLNGDTLPEGSGVIVSYRDFLGNSFLSDLIELQALGIPKDVRIIFWFDN